MKMTKERYVAALERIGEQIKDGSEFVYYDDTTPGDHDLHCSWGLCSNSEIAMARTRSTANFT